MIAGVFPAGLLVAIVGVVLAGVTYYFTNPNVPPRFHTVFAYIGFGVAVMWIYCIANEIVVLLQVILIIISPEAFQHMPPYDLSLKFKFCLIGYKIFLLH